MCVQKFLNLDLIMAIQNVYQRCICSRFFDNCISTVFLKRYFSLIPQKFRLKLIVTLRIDSSMRYVKANIIKNDDEKKKWYKYIQKFFNFVRICSRFYLIEIIVRVVNYLFCEKTVLKIQRLFINAFFCVCICVCFFVCLIRVLPKISANFLQ